jgi:hypothetical protein
VATGYGPLGRMGQHQLELAALLKSRVAPTLLGQLRMTGDPVDLGFTTCAEQLVALGPRFGDGHLAADEQKRQVVVRPIGDPR